ncbi:hypothetical protein ACRAWB_14605 [Leifsonia poae]|uniref:glycan biosynthesis hexose transferase WsfD n=1 Tax=Leifsonia poae TaxID=110933 RepID=UPI003D68CCFE
MRTRIMDGDFRWLFAVLFGALATGIMLLRLFVPVPVGMADNGDGLRLMCQVGVGPHATSRKDLFNSWAILDYFTVHVTPGSCLNYPSTTKLLMQFWAYLSHETGATAGLDLRFALLTYAIFVGLLVLALTLLFRSPVIQGIVAVLFVLVVGDTAFADYLASPFTETAGIVGLIGMAVSGAYLGAFRAKRVASVLALPVFLGCAYLLVNAKTQMITIIAPIALFLLWHAVRLVIDVFRARTFFAVAAAVVAVGVGFSGLGLLGVSAKDTYDRNPDDFAVINPTEVIFVGILGISDDPAADLREMDLPEGLADRAGNSWWRGVEAPQNDELFPAVEHKMTYGTAAAFLLHHPDRAIAMANVAANDFLAARTDYLGNFAKESGAKAGTQDGRLVVASTTLATLKGGGLVVLFFFSVLLLVGAIFALRRLEPGTIKGGLASVSLLLFAIAWTQFVTCAYGEAIENTKHLVVAVLAGMLCATTLIAAALAEGERRPPRPERARRGAAPTKTAATPEEVTAVSA